MKNVIFWICCLAISFFIQWIIQKYCNRMDRISDDLFDIKQELGLVDVDDCHPGKGGTSHQWDFYLYTRANEKIKWQFMTIKEWEQYSKYFPRKRRVQAEMIGKEIFEQRETDLNEIREAIKSDN